MSTIIIRSIPLTNVLHIQNNFVIGNDYAQQHGFNHIKPRHETMKYVPMTTQNLLHMQQPQTVPVHWVAKHIRKLNSGVWHNLKK